MNEPWRSAVTLSKQSEWDTSSNGGSRTETGLGCSGSLELWGESDSVTWQWDTARGTLHGVSWNHK